MVHSVAPVKGSRLVEAFRFLVSTFTAGLGLIALSILVVYFCLFRCVLHATPRMSLITPLPPLPALALLAGNVSSQI